MLFGELQASFLLLSGDTESFANGFSLCPCPLSLSRVLSQGYRGFIGLRGLIFVLTCRVDCDIFTQTTKVCAFLNHVQSIEVSACISQVSSEHPLCYSTGNQWGSGLF